MKYNVYVNIMENSNQLISSAGRGNLSSITALLASGQKRAAINLALVEAACHGHEQCVGLLLNAGADVHFKGDSALRAAMHHARSFATVERLVEAGANVDTYGGLPLKLAVLYRRADIASLLIESGADISKAMDAETRAYTQRYCSEAIIGLLKPDALFQLVDSSSVSRSRTYPEFTLTSTFDFKAKHIVHRSSGGGLHVQPFAEANKMQVRAAEIALQALCRSPA